MHARLCVGADVVDSDAAARFEDRAIAELLDDAAHRVGTHVVEQQEAGARLHGLEKVMAGEMLQFPGDVAGIAMNLDEDQVGAVLLGGRFLFGDQLLVALLGGDLQRLVPDPDPSALRRAPLAHARRP